MALNAFVKKVFGSANDRRLKPLFKRVEAINALEAETGALTDEELRGRTDTFRKRLEAGETLDDIMNDAFATVREAAKRALGQRHYDVQLVGGMVMHQGAISEMKTGEGKTLVATAPVYLNALEGRGVHVVTVNDYLAQRDADWMARVYNFLGMEVGCIVHGLTDAQRRQAYAADITYGTNNEFGFDYLRDNMKGSLEEMVQRGHRFAIVDEVDSILIDEARTPLIISGPTDDKSDLYTAIDGFIPQLEDEDYEIDERSRQATLTEEGNEKIEGLLRDAGYLEGEDLYDAANVTLVHHVNNALKAHKIFQRDKDYIVRQGKVMIIDEFTGRMMEGRRWSEGLHQAVEAKEKVDIQPENQTMASITFQNYFRLYDKLAGMTGTALTEEGEFNEIYKLEVRAIPTNRQIQRADYDDELYMTAEEKYEAITEQLIECHLRGQPVLVGTVSIEKSEVLSAYLQDKKGFEAIAKRLETEAEELGDKKDKDKERKAELLKRAAEIRALAKNKPPLPHNVLNARYHEQEAEIVAEAGVPGAITIATNMAGRGTDIQLGGSVDRQLMTSLEEGDDEETIARKRAKIEAQVAEQKQKAIDAGGLFVLGTERHESRRIDNQLRGRSGRQGDPGASKFYLSLEDDLMRIFGAGLEKMLKRFGIERGESIEHPWFTRAVETAQKKVEQRNFDIRKNVLKYDDVVNDQRKAIFEQRIEFMSAEAVDDVIADMRDELIGDLVATYVPAKSYAEQWDLDGLEAEIREIWNADMPVKAWASEEGVADDEIRERIRKQADSLAARRAVEIGPDMMRRIEKMLLLNTLDHNWREHLQTLDHLRSVVGLRGYGQRDPLNEFKTEAFSLFEALLSGLRKDVVRTLANVRVQPARPPEEFAPEVSHDGMIEIHRDPRTGENETDAPDRRAAPRRIEAGSVMRDSALGAAADPNDPATWSRVSRNAPCPCGSGKKYKACHGALTNAAS